MYLNCHTNYSFKYGTHSIEELISEAEEKGIEALGLTDINNTSAVFTFVKKCNKKGIHPIIGIEFRSASNQLLYIGLAKNREGFHELNSFLSHHNLNKKSLPENPWEFNNCYVIYPFKENENRALKENEFLGIRISDLRGKTHSYIHMIQHKLVMHHPITLKEKTGFSTHRLLRAIHNNTILTKLSPNDLGEKDEIMLPIDKLINAYSYYPAIIKNTESIISSCKFEVDFKTWKNKKTFTGSRYDDVLFLDKLSWDGFENRYHVNKKEAKERVKKELEIIKKLEFETRFLEAWDVTRYADSLKYLSVGRGSGANSVVAYCLDIHDVEPIGLDLYFERFLNPERTSPPDFDLDFSWKQRDSIVEYLFKRYGSKHTAFLGSYNTFNSRSIIREVGKTFGLSKEELDNLVAGRRAERKDWDELTKYIPKYAPILSGMPKHLSVHAGGILIGEEPLTYYTALNISQKGFPITQFDMHVAEDINFHKLDILSQRGLGHIQDTIKIVKQNKGINIELDFHKAEKDEKVKTLIRTGETVGVFYMESPAMRSLFKKLKGDTFILAVAATSLIRPAVVSSGMQPQYIKRYLNSKDVKYLHPILEILLKETFGVMVYQEDVLKVGHELGGLTLGESDLLRRTMTAKDKGSNGFDKLKIKFFEGCAKNGVDKSIIEEIWRQMESFAGYSFSKAHSASFTIEGYYSAYLKVNYPLEFMTAVINNYGGYYSTDYYLHEARRLGAKIEPPCLNKSDIYATLYDDTIFLGFHEVDKLPMTLKENIVVERIQNGEYKSLENFIDRVHIGEENLNTLININAFRFTGIYRRELRWYASQYFRRLKSGPKPLELFESEIPKFKIPELTRWKFEDSYEQFRILGYPLCFPFDLLPPEYNKGITGKDMISQAGKRVEMVGYYITIKDTQTKQGDHMAFSHFIDKNGDTFDTTHFPDSLSKFPFVGKRFYLLKGSIDMSFGYPSLTVSYMEKLPFVKKEVEHARI